MKSLGDVAVRVDASNEIGLGHARRCVTLMKQLRDDGFRVHLIGAHGSSALIEPLLDGLPASWLQDGAPVQDAESTLSVIGSEPGEGSWVVVDHYKLGEQWEKSIREAGYRLVAIDDFRDREHCADILVGDAAEPFNPQLNSCPDTALELAGPEYSLIDSAFAFTDPAPPSEGGGCRLLVSFGASDPTDETTKTLEAVRLLRQDLMRERFVSVDLVIGPANSRALAVKHSVKRIVGVTVHQAPTSLAPLMMQADVVLTSGGHTMLEALSMRRTCVVIVTADNQRLSANALAGRRAIVLLGEHAHVGVSHLAEGLDRLFSGSEPIDVQHSTLPILDHRGAERVSAAMQAMPALEHKP